MDGTEALDGSSNQGTPFVSQDDWTQQQQQPQQAPPQQGGDQGPAPSTAVMPEAQGGQPLPQAATQPMVTVKKRGGLSGLLQVVADLLDNPSQSHLQRDGDGNLQRVTDPNKTSRQQWAHIGQEALQGATAVMATPPGPAHTQQGIANAIGQQFAIQGDQQRQDQEQADHNFAVQQRAKTDNLNYQLGVRDLAAKSFELTRRQVKGTQEDVDFAQKQEDREKALGSFDLGTFNGAMDLHQVLQQQPQFFDKLHQGLVSAVPVFDPSGKRMGVHVFERRPDVMSQPAPEGTQVPVWTPGSKPGQGWHTEWITPSSATNADIDRYQTKYWNDSHGYAKAQADLAHTTAQTNEANAQAVHARAGAAKDYAETRKTQIEAHNLMAQGTGDDGNISPNQSNAQMMVDGLLSSSQLSKRAKDFNQMLPMAQAYSMQKYGVPFDVEVSEGRYQARKKTIEAFANGKEGDQIQTFNQFLAHAGDLTQSIDQLRNSNVAILNTPLKQLRTALGDTQYAKIAPMIAAVRTEHSNFLNNNHALHEQDIDEGHDMLSDTQTLGQAQAAIKSFVSTAVRRTGALNNRYRRVVQVGDVPDLLDPLSRDAINRLGLAGEANSSLGSAWTNQPHTVQQQTTPPRPGTAPQQQPQQQAPRQQPQQVITVQPGEPTATGANGQTLVVRNGQWVPAQHQ